MDWTRFHTDVLMVCINDPMRADDPVQRMLNMFTCAEVRVELERRRILPLPTIAGLTLAEHEAWLADPRPQPDAEPPITLYMPGESCDGMKVKIVKRAKLGEAVYVELLENRPMKDGSTGWKIGDRIQVKKSEVR
jgi:hypothetical protein